MSDTIFCITSWDKDKFEALKAELVQRGIDASDIEMLSEKASRSKVLNKALDRHATKYKYICLLDDDVKLMPGEFVPRMKQIFEAYENVGCVVAPVQQFKEFPAEVVPALPKDTPIEKSLTNMSSNLITLNCVMLRADLDERFEEDLFGNQSLDLDFGWELLRAGLISVADGTLAVGHIQTNYVDKNLFYHAVVARNNQILKAKWSDRDAWTGVLDYNESHLKDPIISLEELSHANEGSLVQYIAKYDKFGLIDCYLAPRLSQIHAVSDFIKIVGGIANSTEQIYKFECKDAMSLPHFAATV